MGTRVDAGSFSFDLEERCDQAEQRIQEVLADWEANYKGKTSDRPRISTRRWPGST